MLWGSACGRQKNEREYYQNSCLITGGKRLHSDTLMEPLSYEILQNWQVRKTRKQKLAFAEMMQSRISDLRVEEGGFLHCRNLVLGDVEAAKVVFTAHYDTCAKLPFPNLVTPKNIMIYLGYSLLISLPFLVLMFGLTLLLGLWLGAAGAFLGMLIGLGAMFYVFFLGPANPHTVNDNTSGVLTLVEAIARMSEEERAWCAFIFFDREENGLLGSGWFASKHKKTMKDKLLVNFDCVSDGDDFLFVLSRKGIYRKKGKGQLSVSDKIDRIVTNRILALPRVPAAAAAPTAARAGPAAKGERWPIVPTASRAMSPNEQIVPRKAADALRGTLFRLWSPAARPEKTRG